MSSSSRSTSTDLERLRLDLSHTKSQLDKLAASPLGYLKVNQLDSTERVGTPPVSGIPPPALQSSSFLLATPPSSLTWRNVEPGVLTSSGGPAAGIARYNDLPRGFMGREQETKEDFKGRADDVANITAKLVDELKSVRWERDRLLAAEAIAAKARDEANTRVAALIVERDAYAAAKAEAEHKQRLEQHTTETLRHRIEALEESSRQPEYRGFGLSSTGPQKEATLEDNTERFEHAEVKDIRNSSRDVSDSSRKRRQRPLGDATVGTQQADGTEEKVHETKKVQYCEHCRSCQGKAVTWEKLQEDKNNDRNERRDIRKQKEDDPMSRVATMWEHALRQAQEALQGATHRVRKSEKIARKAMGEAAAAKAQTKKIAKLLMKRDFANPTAAPILPQTSCPTCSNINGGLRKNEKEALEAQVSQLTADLEQSRIALQQEQQKTEQAQKETEEVKAQLRHLMNTAKRAIALRDNKLNGNKMETEVMWNFLVQSIR